MIGGEFVVDDGNDVVNIVVRIVVENVYIVGYVVGIGGRDLFVFE